MPSFSRQLLLTIHSACALFLALASHALSQELIIDGPVTDTQVIDGVTYDTIIISGDGSISTTGSSEHGVDSSGNGNTITNLGTIFVNDSLADGIRNSAADTMITNIGLIQAGDEGIENTGDTSIITNSGTIRTIGSNAEGIYNSGDSTIIENSGTITTSGTSADGVTNFGDSVGITNTGTIQAGDRGINNFGAYVTVVNSGAIYSNGDGIYSNDAEVIVQNRGLVYSGGKGIVDYGTDARIANSGTIVSDEEGIFLAGDDALFVNSGKVVSGEEAALRVLSFASGTTVNLNAPSFLGGAITFESETTLNISTGASHSVLWQLPTTDVAGGQANVSGPIPWFYDTATGQFATFDPTGLTASFNQMANTANMLGRLGRYGLRQTGRGRSAEAAALAYGEDGTQGSESFDVLLATNSGPDAAYGLKTGSFWLTGFGGGANYDGDDLTLDYSIDQIGAALGYAWNQSPDMRLGVMAGYMNGSITATSPWADSQDLTSNGVFAGVHGDRRFGPVSLGLGLAGGWQTSDSSRFVNDNTALTGGLTLGESTADASYDSWFVTPEAALSADIALERTGIILTPSVRGRYALQQTGSYTETGAAANATVDSHTFAVAEGDFELALSRSFQLVTLTGRAGYLVRSSTGDDDVPVTLLGITNSVGLGATDRSAAYLGAALDLNLGPQASFTLDGQGYLSDDVDALEGMARFAIRF
nr:autotransporter domain-containing protein [uncultured Roseibium sp.]